MGFWDRVLASQHLASGLDLVHGWLHLLGPGPTKRQKTSIIHTFANKRATKLSANRDIVHIHILVKFRLLKKYLGGWGELLEVI